MLKLNQEKELLQKNKEMFVLLKQENELGKKKMEEAAQLISKLTEDKKLLTAQTEKQKEVIDIRMVSKKDIFETF